MIRMAQDSADSFPRLFAVQFLEGGGGAATARRVGRAKAPGATLGASQTGTPPKWWFSFEFPVNPPGKLPSKTTRRVMVLVVH